MLENLFEECDNPTLLCFLLKKIPLWSSSGIICRHILDSLDDLFSFAYNDAQPVSNLQYIVANLANHIKLEEIFESIEPGYVLTNLNRAGCITDSTMMDGFYINTDTNEKAISVLDVFLTAFSDVGTKIQRESFQACLVDGMKEAAIFGNWQQFKKIYDYATPNLSANLCLQDCSKMCSSEERNLWLDKNWNH